MKAKTVQSPKAILPNKQNKRNKKLFYYTSLRSTRSGIMSHHLVSNGHNMIEHDGMILHVFDVFKQFLAQECNEKCEKCTTCPNVLSDCSVPSA